MPAEVSKVLSSAKNKEVSDKPKEGVKPQPPKKLRDGKQKQKVAKQQFSQEDFINLLFFLKSCAHGKFA